MEDLTMQKKELIENNIKYIVIHNLLAGNKLLHIEPYKKNYKIIYDDEENVVLQVY
jgi:hypothetical protein